MIRHLRIVLLGPALAAGLAAPSTAQTATPQTYSYTQDPAIPLMGPMVITLSRDRSKEVVDQVFPPSDTQPKGFHAHLTYDFAAHKIYTQIVSDPSTPCSVMDYASPAAPAEFDVISGAADLMKELTSDATEPLKPVGKDTIGGTATTVFEENGKGGKGRLWLADKGGYPMKVAVVGPDGKEQTIIEVKQLSFARPPATNFIPPAGCQQVQGVSTATGGHAEIAVGDGSDAKPVARVTASTLQAIPHYKGACPAKITMVGTITTDGPGTVWYWFAAGSSDPGEALTFTAAGRKTVTHVMTFPVDPKYGNSMGGSALLQAVMEDNQGNHGIAGTGSNNSDFTIECTGR